MDLGRQQLDHLRAWVNAALKDYEPWQVAAASATTAVLASYAYGQLTHKVRH